MRIPQSVRPAPVPHLPASVSQPQRTNACSFKGKGWIEFQALSMLPAQVKGCASRPFRRTMKLCLKKCPQKNSGQRYLEFGTWGVRQVLVSTGVDIKKVFLHSYLQTSQTSTQLTNTGMNSRHLLTMKNRINALTHMFWSSAMAHR